MMTQPFQDELRGMTLLPLVEGRPACLAVHESAPIEKVILEMTNSHYSSIPVQNSRGQFIGITNIMDVILFVMGFVWEDLSPSRINEIDADAKNRLGWAISSCLGLTDEGKRLWKFSFDASFSSLLEAFHKGVHRVLVQGPEWGISRVISQADVLSFLFQHLEELQEVASQPFFSSGEPYSPMFSIFDEVQAYHAFAQMAVHGVRGIPVLDRPGRLIASVDAGDIKGIKPDEMSKILLPLRAFFEEIRKPFSPPVTCREGEKLGEVLSLFVKCGTHAIWMVDEDMRPLATITPSDVIARFASLSMV